jgi:outer membrane protein, heavy metal efflux system
MRRLIWVCTLASFASAASAQQPDSTIRRPVGAPDTLAMGLPAVPDCLPRGMVGSSTGGNDSLCVGRREAVAMALLRNPQLLAGREQLAQARGLKAQGTAIPDPVFSLEVNEATGLFGGGRATDKILGTWLTIPFLDKFRLQGRIGRADVQATEAGLAAFRQIIAAQTAQTYDSVLAALRRRQVLQEAKALSEDFLRKTEARFEAGSTPRLDVVRARVDVAQAENDLISSEREVANARASLNRLLDRPLAAPIAMADTLAIPPELPSLEVLESAALAARPELAALQRQQEGARATTSLAKEYWLPDVFVGLSHNYADPGPGLLSTGVAFPIPIFYWQHAKGEIAVSRHRELELTAIYRDLQAQIGQDVRATYATAATALRQAVYLRDALLPAAREAYRIASVSYGLGGSSALDVLDARRALRDAEGQYADVLAEANMARADLERAVARPLEELGPGGVPR